MSEKVPDNAQESERPWERADHVVRPPEKTTHVPEESARNLGRILAEASEDLTPPTFTELVEENRKLKAQISDLKSAAGQRQKAEERLRTVIESAPNAMMMINPDGRIVLINAQLEFMFGYSREELLGKQLEVLIPERYRHKHPEHRKGYSERPSTRGMGVGRDLFGIRNDGLEFPVEIGLNPIHTEEGLFIVSSIVDITERKRSELLLRRTTTLQRAILNAANQSIISTDINGIVQSFNKGAERMLGYGASEVIGQCTLELFHSKEELRNRALELSGGKSDESTVSVLLVAPLKGESEEREWTYVRKDGSSVEVRLAVTAVRDSAGEIDGFLGIATDITARKFLESELLLNNEKLAEQTRRAEEANRAKSQFLAAMSHEIRTPMNAILGMSDLLWESELNAEQKQYVEIFRRAGSGLLALINDILDLSKIEAGHFEIEQVDFDLEEVVDQAVELIRAKARAKGIVLLSRLSPGVTTALIGDPTRLRQILLNLLGNAVKFTNSGEVVLTVQDHEAGTPGQVDFTISDTGIGISPEQLETIFDDFSQADSSTTRKYGGTGLGLGISRRLIERMGGSLAVASTIGEGSTFSFTAKFELAAENKRKASIEVEDFEGRCVLVIDNNATNRLILRETLSVWGLECDDFSTPREALKAISVAMAAGRRYSLVIVDGGMPEMNGFEVVAEIKKIASALPVVLLTSDINPSDAARHRKAGFSGYAVKPVTRTELLHLVCEAMKALENQEPQPFTEIEPVEKIEPAHPIKILVAEDSADNRLLIQAYMKGSPHTLTFVEDGKAAFDQSVAAHFGLILMDIQMPVMDGLHATRRIRVMERERGLVPVPIVALTANASPRDVERSLTAGCNGHLSKPISKRKLLSTIAELGEPFQTPDVPGIPPPIGSQILPELEELVPGYIAARKEELPEMLALLASSDFDRIRVLGHNMKGSGDSYGFPELSRFGVELERLAQQSDRAALTEQLTELENYLNRIEHHR